MSAGFKVVINIDENNVDSDELFRLVANYSNGIIQVIDTAKASNRTYLVTRAPEGNYIVARHFFGAADLQTDSLAGFLEHCLNNRRCVDMLAKSSYSILIEQANHALGQTVLSRFIRYRKESLLAHEKPLPETQRKTTRICQRYESARDKIISMRESLLSGLNPEDGRRFVDYLHKSIHDLHTAKAELDAVIQFS